MINSLSQNLNFVWRLFATAFGFSLFGIGALFISTVIFPVISIFSKDKTKLARELISGSFRFYIRFISLFGVMTMRVKNADLIREDRSTIVIANHPTLLDIVFLISLCPNASCIVKKELWNNFFLRRIVTIAGYIPNNNTDQLIRSCDESLAKGDNIIIFPEGTRSGVSRNAPFQRGFAYISLNSQANIRIVKMKCNPPTLSKGVPWYKIPKKRFEIDMEISDLVSPIEASDSSEPKSVLARKLSTNIQEKYYLS